MKCSVMRCVLLLFSLSTASSHGHDPVIRRDSTVATTTAMEAEALKLVQTQQLHNAMVMIQSLSDKQAAEQQRNDKINSLLKAGKFALKASTPGKPKHPFMIAGQQSSAGGNQTMPTDTLMKQFLAANKKKQATPSTPSQSPKAVDEASHSLIKTATKISKPSGQAKSSGPPSTAKMPKMKGIKGKGVAPSASPVPSSSPVPPMPTVKLIQENTVTNVTKRTLSLAAFEYTVTSTNKPSDADYKELISITDSVFRDMYLSFFTSIPNVAFGSSEITTYTALEPYLVQFDVNLYFEGAATVPDLGQLEEVARQELAQGASYNDIYLQRMKTLASNIFSTTTSVIYISEKADLTAAMKINGTVTVTPGSTSQSVSTGGSTDNNNSVTKIVSPIAAFAGLLLLGGLLANRFKRNRAEPTMDKNVNLMKHVRDGDDVESGTVSGNTYRTGAFTDDGTLGSIGAFEDFRRQKTSKKLQKELEKVMDDLEEVSLGDDCGSTSSGNSDGTMVAYPKSVMSEALKAKKIKKHDESVKPDWASRSASKTFESKEEKIVMRSEQDASTPKNKIVPVDDSGVQTHVAQPAAADDSIIADRVAGSETKVISARPRRFKSETRSSSPSDMFSSDQLKVPESSNVVKNYRVSAKNLAFSPGSPPYLPELNAVESTRTVLAMPELKFKDTSINCTLPGAYFPAAIANKDLTLAATTGKADYASPATERVTDTHSFITPNYSDSPVTYNVHQMPAFTAEIPEASSSKAEKDAIHVVTEASDFPEAVSEDSAKASINAETHVSESTTEAETETPTPSIKAETDALENPIEATVVVPKDSTVAAYVPDAPMEAESTTPRAKNDRKYSLQQSPPMPIADSATSLQTTKQVDKDVEKSTMSTTRLRHVSPNAKSDNPEPEWMQKFKQMGLDKAE